MYRNQIIRLLSSHRQPHRPELPQSLSVHTIATLIHQSLSPQQATNRLSEQLQTDLRQLQAEGEVFSGIGNRFCITPPVLLVESEDNLTGLRFRGDRTYLSLAHQVMETGQPHSSLILHPKIQGLHRIKTCLKSRGIALLTAANSIDHLPEPQIPHQFVLQGFEWQDSPFQTHLWQQGAVKKYVPQSQKRQTERWVEISRVQESDTELLRLSTGEFLWFKAGQCYELPPDMAVLTMFRLDRESNSPLQVAWDEAPGRLDLRGVTLPSSYAQMLWRLSQPENGENRIRLYEPSKRPFVHAALNRLGCILV